MQPLVLAMRPAPGDRLQRFVGDTLEFVLADGGGAGVVPGWRALLRTNLGRAALLRQEIIQAHTHGLPLAGASWRDLPMQAHQGEWRLKLPLTEPGYFKAKAYLVDPRGWQHWPEGPDVGVAVHPDWCRTANTIYCAFTRLFGPSRTAVSTRQPQQQARLERLDRRAYTVIPPSGKLRDLQALLPHIMGVLGCRILHLLPIHPTPTTYARFGRFGSPYAALDLTAVDPALVAFDRRTTALDQFRDLAYAVHVRAGRLFLDIVINHTGWGSLLQENHPEWFLRRPDGRFVSPGAWGTTWEDLVELEHVNVALWDDLAEMFLTWCRRGVDGFRCDAGYKVPVAAWQYLVARVQQEFPETVFLLEGLGGSWEATEALLTEGGLQWAYSELFQNLSAQQVADYLDHSFRQAGRTGLLVHYSETHDNNRLAAKGRAWSLLRNRLCALTSVSGGFGFTGGVEWLATEKIRVHGCSGLAWDNPDNLLPELARLNTLLAEHPCFFEAANLTRLTPPGAPVYALRRDSAEGSNLLLVLVNTDADRAHSLTLRFAPPPSLPPLARWVDLLGQVPPEISPGPEDELVLALAAGAAYCLAPFPLPGGLAGQEYRRARAQAAWVLSALGQVLPLETAGELDWRALAAAADRSPERVLALISHLANGAPGAPQGLGVPSRSERDGATGASASLATLGQDAQAIQDRLKAELQAAVPQCGTELQADGRKAKLQTGETAPEDLFPCVVTWQLPDRRRITLVPPGHWLLIRDTVPFRATLDCREAASTDQPAPCHVASIPVQNGHVAAFAPRSTPADADLSIERYADGADRQVQAAVRFLPPRPGSSWRGPQAGAELSPCALRRTDLVLLTNGRGGMARLCVDLGRVNSKYDCVLGANLHAELPVDRHVLAKRLRVWVNADGFISPLHFRNLAAFQPGPPAAWQFVALAGDGRTVEIHVTADMLPERNTTVFYFRRPAAVPASGRPLPPEADVRLTVRLDLEDRNFHWETKRNGGAEHHFATHTHSFPEPPQQTPDTSAAAQKVGFAFTPARDRQLRVFADSGAYRPQPEWSENIPHPVEQSRGQTGSGDAFSPGWFDLPMPPGGQTSLVVTADPADPAPKELEVARGQAAFGAPSAGSPAFAQSDVFGQQLVRAAQAFVVRRGQGLTVIAGYPWFLDWGRDACVCARGLLAAGLTGEISQLLLTLARLEKDGTLPNSLHAGDASDRDTADAPLWFGLACEELAALAGGSFHATNLGRGDATIADVLRSIGVNYARGTFNGIRMDPASALIFSPKHFTWMDTNHPACTPREGYPIELQALWIRLLRQLDRLPRRANDPDWRALADRAHASVEQLFWRQDQGYYADLLIAPAGQPAAGATVDDALRSNGLLVVSLGLAKGQRARRCVDAALRWLVVPGAVRSLAPRPVTVPLPIYAPDGRLLNNPSEPYWGRYEGDEDTRRKPAYHNGAAWTWTLPVFCEALARAWDFAPAALAAARAYLASLERLMGEGCLGQIPEILDGDAPHTQRGCDAQAWSVTEALRVWKLLGE